MNKKKIETGKIEFFDNQINEISSFTKFSQLVAIRYLDTNAGSNPREFTGMTPTNHEILKSVLKNSELFWSYHSGVIITMLNTNVGNDLQFDKDNGRTGSIYYEDACLTDGLQSVSILRLLLIIKIYQESSNRGTIHTKITSNMMNPLTKALKDELGNDTTEFLLDTIGLKQINQVTYWLNKPENKEYYNIINNIKSNEILNMRIAFKAIRLESIIDQYIGKNDSEVFGDDKYKKIGYEIATANNTYQMVKEDDKFGTVYKEWLENNIMSGIKEDVNIIYRINSKSNNEKNIIKKHILDILRALIPTTLIINNEKFENSNQLHSLVSAYTSYRRPIYKLFENYIDKCNNNPQNLKLMQNKEIIRNLMPNMLHVMCRFESILKSYYRDELTFQKACDLLGYGMEEQKKGLKVRLKCADKDDKDEIDKIVKKSLSVSPSVLFSIFVYSTHNLINIDSNLKVTYEINDELMKKIIEMCVYQTVLKARISKQYGSLSDLFRSQELYSEAKERVELITGKIHSDVDVFRVNLAKI